MARSIWAVPLDEIPTAVAEFSRRGQYVFATDLVKDFYESFGPSWTAFVAAVRRSHDPDDVPDGDASCDEKPPTVQAHECG